MRSLSLLFICGQLAVAHCLGSVAVILHGESFRQKSHQGSRATGPLGFYSQKAATRSHIEHLLLPLVFDMGYSSVVLYMDTYATNLSASLISWYGPYYDRNRTVWGSTGVADHIRAVTTSPENFEALFVTRFDVILKASFSCALRIADRNKILFSFRCWTRGDTLGKDWARADRIADMMTWVPRKHFDFECIPCLVNNHDARGYIRKHKRKRWELANVGYILPGDQHDSDPEKDWNPLYKLAARPEGADVASITLQRPNCTPSRG
jgi:hypothetical protein